MTNDQVDPADVGRQIREEEGWVMAQLLILYAIFEQFWRADSWLTRGKYVFWLGIYGTIGAVAVLYWLIVTPLKKLWAAMQFIGHLLRLGAEKTVNNPRLPAKQAARDVPKLPKAGAHVARNAVQKLRTSTRRLWERAKAILGTSTDGDQA